MSAVMPSSKPSLWRTVKTVAWSFVGLRGRKGFEQDIQHVKPLHVVVVGLVGVVLFVGGLIALVNWVVPG